MSTKIILKSRTNIWDTISKHFCEEYMESLLTIMMMTEIDNNISGADTTKCFPVKVHFVA